MPDPWIVVALVVGAAVPASLLGYVVGRRRARGGGAPDRSAPAATLAVLDSLVADSIKGLRGWLVSGPDRLTLAADGTITLLFSDIAGSTSINHRLGDERFAKLLRAHDDIVDRSVSRHRGRVVKTQGDGFMAAFHDPVDAVTCALALQGDLGDSQRVGEPLRLRIGVHIGSAVTTDHDVFGAAVAFTARVASEASGGQVLASQALRERVEPTETDVEFRGRLLPRRLKGVPGWHRLHEVVRQ